MSPRAPDGLTLEAVAALARLRLASPVSAPASHPAPDSDFDLDPALRPQAPVLSPAAVLVGLFETDAGLQVLLTRRSDRLRRHSGQVAFPGGRLEPGEGPVEAALRESQEEVGLEPAFIEPWGLGDRYETGTGFVITPVVAGLRPGFRLTADVQEVAEIFHAPFGRLMDPAAWELRSLIRDGVERRFFAQDHDGRTIWGATAGMLRGIAARLFSEPSHEP